MAGFFISYNQADRAWAVWVAWHLRAAGYIVHLQASDSTPGTNFVREMNSAAQQTDHTIAILSPDYLTSPFTFPEWASAFARDPTGERGTLIPVRVRDCTLEGLLRQIVYVDLVGLDEPVARDKLLTDIQAALSRAHAQALQSAEPPPFPGGNQSSLASNQPPAASAPLTPHRQSRRAIAVWKDAVIYSEMIEDIELPITSNAKKITDVSESMNDKSPMYKIEEDLKVFYEILSRVESIFSSKNRLNLD